MTEDKWDRILAVNLKGPFFVSRAAIPLMRAGGGGSIVNVASVAGVAGSGSSIAYAASKGGLITMTKSLAKAFAPDIRVNAVCPGVIISRWLEGHEDMVEAAVKNHAARTRLIHRRHRRRRHLPRLRSRHDNRPGAGRRWRTNDVENQRTRQLNRRKQR